MSEKADYGIYGSVRFYGLLILVAIVTLIVSLFIPWLRTMLLIVLSINLLIGSFMIGMGYAGGYRPKLIGPIVEKAKVKPGDRVLDIGTGRGFLAIEIAKTVAFSYAVGIDVWEKQAKGQMHKGFIIDNSKENAEKNASLERVSDRVEFGQCDAREMPFKSESFDVVVSSAAVHQMVYFGGNDYRVLDETLRVLKPGGRFVNVDPMIGHGVIEYLAKIGFRDVKVENAVHIGPIALLKILSSRKP